MFFIVSMFLSSAIPTPAQALLDGTSSQKILWVAQTPNKEEQKNLQEDMNRARQKVDEHRHDVQQEQGSPEDLNVERPRPPRRHKHRVRPLYDAPTLDGHGKAYYMTWGIVEWVLAGGAWYGGFMTTIGSIATTSLLYQDRHGRIDGERRDYVQGAASGFAAASVVLGMAGGLLAWKASENLSKASDLRAEDREMRYRYGVERYSPDADNDEYQRYRDYRRYREEIPE